MENARSQSMNINLPEMEYGYPKRTAKVDS